MNDLMMARLLTDRFRFRHGVIFGILHLLFLLLSIVFGVLLPADAVDAHHGFLYRIVPALIFHDRNLATVLVDGQIVDVPLDVHRGNATVIVRIQYPKARLEAHIVGARFRLLLRTDTVYHILRGKFHVALIQRWDRSQQVECP